MGRASLAKRAPAVVDADPAAAQRERQALGGSRPSRLLTRTYATKPSRNWTALAESPARMVGRPHGEIPTLLYLPQSYCFVYTATGKNFAIGVIRYTIHTPQMSF